MFSRLPQPIKTAVLKHLQKDDFVTAKKLYDDWYRNQGHKVVCFQKNKRAAVGG